MEVSIESVKVLIMDRDVYFMAGLRAMVSDLLLEKNIDVQFIERPLPGLYVDIDFQAIGYGMTVDVCRSLKPGVLPPLLFLIQDQRDMRLSPKIQIGKQSGTLYRYQPIDVVNSMLEEAIAVQRAQPVHTKLDAFTQLLTLREREVLSYLRQGKSHEETANVMSLHVKTVSSHKRSAMRKLNFKRNHELFHWLLQGGLTTEEKDI